MTRMPGISDVFLGISAVALVGILFFIILEGPPININPMELKAQIFIAFLASFLSMIVALAAIYFKDFLDNRPPLEFKFDLEQNQKMEVKFIFYYKNNINTTIKIESYHISISKTGIDKPILDRCPHFSSELVYSQEGWQEKPFNWTFPKNYNIVEKGTYSIVVTIKYKYKNKDGTLFYAIPKDIDTGVPSEE